MNIRIVPRGTDLTEAVLAMAREAGCNCQPDIEVPNRRDRRAGVTHSAIAHDDWCRLIVRMERRN